jgi:hypothetical protein
LLALAHFFEGITLAVLSSSHGYGHLMPWGSHPLTDVLLSSSRLSTAHYGNVYTRVEKTAEVAKDPLALSLLGVCGYGRREHQFVNCSRCEKCLRTMVTLDLVGVDRAHASTFDWTAYDPTKLSKIFLRTDSEASFFEEIIATARRANRPEIVAACERAIQRSRKYRFLVAGELMVRTRVPAVLRYKDQLLTAKSTVYRMLNLQRTA